MEKTSSDYIQRVTDFFESYYEIHPSYYEKGTKRLRPVVIKNLMEQLVEDEVFVDESDIRTEALMEYDVVLPRL